MAKVGRKPTRRHAGALTGDELRAAIDGLRPKARVAPTDDALALATAKRLETMAANKAELVAEVEAARVAAVGRRAAEVDAVRIGRDDLTARLREDLFSGRFGRFR
jgi:hypothetical protein